ncbi:U2 snRNP-associated SURP motif-containing protein [Homalodisca vitripennis]|nr:U2 snRNP-associated SURP motif-containing protein [Homalodisca vitripennis]XP_046671822.1 U2 snRNP-associated SURP motif-containing protein [Homalodisca vitripennis]
MGDKALMKQIAEQKLKAFSVGTMGKRSMSKKEMEEQRKKEQEEAAAQAFEEFVATFQEAPSKTSKVWVKAGTYDAGKRQEDTKEKGKLYKPQSRLSESIEKMTSAERAQEYARLLSDRKPDRPGKRKEREKKKSNLELFKEELKLIQEEREERHKYKGVIKQMDDPESGVIIDESKIGSFDCGDPTTTNLYLGNLHPKITEQQLMEVFGKYGPLASIKIMWPRSDEEKARARNCGFVAFMNRKDGERALRYLNGKDVMGYEMKLGWGKGVPIPPHPIYIPPAMLELTMPPPPSGLPFNAQPLPRDRHKVPRMRSDGPYPVDPDDMEKMEKILPQALVKVVIPTERNLLMLIHHTIEFVIREGPMFEAMIMNRELNNPMFRFLFENQSPAHIYYRWKLYSMLQGDIQNKWRTSEFRMFKGGSIWRPPPMNPYTQGMPEELVEPEVEPRKGSLSPTQRDRLEDLIRNMTPERLKVAEVMVFCMEHSEAAEEICDCILESLSNPSTALYKKIARLYLISDILHNCGVKITNASYYRRGLEARLIPIFTEIHQTYKSIESRMKAEGFRMRVMKIFQAWEDWAVYSKDFLIRIQNAFLGLTSDAVEEAGSESEEEQGLGEVEQEVEDPEDNEDLDGVPLDGAALLKGALNHQAHDDIDGVPMVEEDIDGMPMDAGSEGEGKSGQGRGETRTAGPGFVMSRWETVDPDLVEAQAMTTSKWETLEQTNHSQEDSQEEDTSNLDLRDSNDDRRAKLREIELKVMQYQDELESGKRSLKYNFTIAHQVEHYRRKLLRKAEKGGRKEEKKEKEKEKRESRKSSSPDESRETLVITTRKSKRARSDSDSPTPIKKSHRSRSRSPRKRKASKSPHSRKSSPSRSKRSSPSSSRKRRSRSSSTPPSSRSKYRSPSPRSPPLRKHSPPSRKHKHKHKSSY